MSNESQASVTGKVATPIGLIFPPSVPGAPESADLIKEKSLVRYCWQPFNDINLVGADGLIRRLGRGQNYYGAGLPGETIEAYMERKGAFLLRCQVYPLWNINYFDSIFNVGPVSQEDERSGNAMGKAAPPVEMVKYAGVCAADMVESYGESHGLRVLTPLTGMDGDDQETAAELVKIIQPYPLKLSNLTDLSDEETLLFDLKESGPAFERIKGAKLDSKLAPMAEQLRKVMLSGAVQADKTARADWGELGREFNRTKLGQKGKTTPSVYDENLAFLLGQPVPTTVQRAPEGVDPDLKAAVKLLAQHALRSDSTSQKQMRGEIQALKMRLGKQGKEE